MNTPVQIIEPTFCDLKDQKVKKIENIMNDSVIYITTLSEDKIEEINENENFTDEEKDFISYIYINGSLYLEKIKKILENTQKLIQLECKKESSREELLNMIETNNIINSTKKNINIHNIHNIPLAYEYKLEEKLGFSFFIPNSSNFYWKKGTFYKKEKCLEKLKKIDQQIKQLKSDINTFIYILNQDYNISIRYCFYNCEIHLEKEIKDFTEELEKYFEVNWKNILEKLNNIKPHKSSP